MTDQEIIKGLIARDNKITQYVFFEPGAYPTQITLAEWYAKTVNS